MIINHNMSANFAQRTLKFSNRRVDGNMEALSSGMRINRAGDDASGLAVSEKMRSQIRGLQRAERNAQDGISFIQTTEGYLQETQDILQRMRELAVQSSNGIYSAEDRMQIQVEISQLVDEINRIASHAQFNGMNMLTGRFASQTGGECGYRFNVVPYRCQHGSAGTRIHRYHDRPGTRRPGSQRCTRGRLPLSPWRLPIRRTSPSVFSTKP